MVTDETMSKLLLDITETEVQLQKIAPLKKAILKDKIILEALALSVFSGTLAKDKVLADGGYHLDDIPSSQIPIDTLFIRLFCTGMQHSKEGLNKKELVNFVKQYLNRIWYPSVQYNLQVEKIYRGTYLPRHALIPILEGESTIEELTNFIKHTLQVPNL